LDVFSALETGHVCAGSRYVAARKRFKFRFRIYTLAKLTGSHVLVTPALLGVAVVFSGKAIADQFTA
jgi:hypothetical protein